MDYFANLFNTAVSNFYQTTKTYGDTFAKTFNVSELQKRFENLPQSFERLNKITTEIAERNGEFITTYVQKSMEHARLQAEKIAEETSKIFKQ